MVPDDVKLQIELLIKKEGMNKSIPSDFIYCLITLPIKAGLSPIF